MPTTTTTATYTKLRTGAWGVRVPSGRVQPGDTVTVTTRAGERKIEEIERVVWTDGQIAICAVRRAGGASTPAGRGRGRGCITGGNCSSFGSGRSCGASDCDGY